MATGTKVLAVNGRQFSSEIVRAAIRDAKGGSAAMELITKDGDIYKTFRVECHTGERYPDLERVAGSADLMGEILRAKVK